MFAETTQPSHLQLGYICDAMPSEEHEMDASLLQRYTYRLLQTIQMKLILLCVWAEWAVLGSAKTALEFKYEI